MAIEAALIKPVVDALMALLSRGEKATLKRNAETALREAIRELLLANPDENKAQARIAIAKAAGILSEDVVLAEDMLQKHRATKAKTSGKAATGRRHPHRRWSASAPAQLRRPAAHAARRPGARRRMAGLAVRAASRSLRHAGATLTDRTGTPPCRSNPPSSSPWSTP